ncbi:MAG: hypothetical protein H0U22_14405 [Geodermatophilaceae bacterium]|nr:hypothetical protein [Geodermatophilaceae bacterium]
MRLWRPPDPTPAADQSGSAAGRIENGSDGMPTCAWTVLVALAVLAVLGAGS